MFSEKSISIRIRFALQLAIASTILVVMFCVMTYQIIKANIYQSQTDELISYAKTIIKQNKDITTLKDNQAFTIQIKQIKDLNEKQNHKIKSKNNKIYFIEKQTNGNYVFLKLFYLYNNDDVFLVLTKDITSTSKIINQILFDIFTVALTTIVLIIFYALFLSRIQLSNIRILNKKLDKLDENFLKPLKKDDLPKEFSSVVESINQLTDKIQTFISSQKELFIGIAHELKTPLAIIKSSNDVTLLKQRDTQRYIDALKECNNSIDRMNKMINTILQIGRQEGAQLEEAQEIDIIKFLSEQSRNFIFLCSEGKTIKTDFKPDSLIMKIQPTLLTHILQNFVQNALKFSPPNSTIQIKSYIQEKILFIEVIDEGEGIKDGLDIFAPFKKYGNKSGVGLGLFLANSAAKAMKAKISLENNKDAKGCKATLQITIKKDK